MKNKMHLILLVKLAMFLASAPCVFANDTAAHEQDLIRKVDELLQLKAENPQAYQRFIGEKRGQFMERLQGLGSQRQERFQQFLERNVGARHERLEFVRQQRPQVFQDFAERRVSQFQSLAQRNPDQYQRFLERHPQFQERLGVGVPTRGSESGSTQGETQRLTRMRVAETTGLDRSTSFSPFQTRQGEVWGRSGEGSEREDFGRQEMQDRRSVERSVSSRDQRQSSEFPRPGQMQGQGFRGLSDKTTFGPGGGPGGFQRTGGGFGQPGARGSAGGGFSRSQRPGGGGGPQGGRSGRGGSGGGGRGGRR